MACTLFTRFYRREAISRCIGSVRGTKIIFLPTRCRGFGLVVELGRLGGAKTPCWPPSAHRFLPDPSALPSDPSEWRLSHFFAPQSLQAGHGDRKTKHAMCLRKANTFSNVRWITRQREGKRNILIALSWCRWTPSTAPPMALLAPQIDHNY